jgi:protein-S-isoprenylcysteine O-methyltransferase Ste14
MSTLEMVALAELVLCWILWTSLFWRRSRRRNKSEAMITDSASRWGIVFQGVGFFLAWLRTSRSNPPVLLIVSVFIAPISVWVAWRAVDHLGKQWRIQAGLYADHELIRSGPYAVVRHPIYASMFGMLLATGLVMARWPLLIAAVVMFLIGAEIRIRVEDALLLSHFGEEFRQYRASVPAYIPFIR